jgi:hypothetical protein
MSSLPLKISPVFCPSTSLRARKDSARPALIGVARVSLFLREGGARGGGRAPPKQFFEAQPARHPGINECRVSRFLREGET